MIQLTGHVDQSSAFIINHFPVMFGKYAKVRYWVEYKPGYGQRCVYQIFNYVHAQGWSNPKGSLYAPIVVMYIQDNPSAVNYGLVEHYSAGIHTMSNEELLLFSTGCYFDHTQKAIIIEELMKRKLVFQESNIQWATVPSKPIAPELTNIHLLSALTMPLPPMQLFNAAQEIQVQPAQVAVAEPDPYIQVAGRFERPTSYIPVTINPVTDDVTDSEYEIAKLYFEEHAEDGTFENLRANPHLAEERSKMRSIINRYEGNDEVTSLSIDDLKQGG